MAQNGSWQLIDSQGTEIEPGQTIIDFRDSAHVFHAITKVPGGNSGGRIQVGDGHGPEYYPSVFDLRIVPRGLKPGEAEFISRTGETYASYEAKHMYDPPSEFSSLTDD